MNKVKRTERLAVIGQILTNTPNKIYTLSYFCELFESAKSTISEDIALLAKTYHKFSLGQIETVTGALGGVRFRTTNNAQNGKAFLNEICQMLQDPDRLLPGDFLYFSDILSNPIYVNPMGNLIATKYLGESLDFVLTMETKGIPVAYATARALNVPLIIARRSSKVYEGSAVNINYVSGSGKIENMVLSRRAVKEGQRALIVDDFTRGGGTGKGMLTMLKEFNIDVMGICFVLALEKTQQEVLPNQHSLMLLSQQEGCASVRPADWVK